MKLKRLYLLLMACLTITWVQAQFNPGSSTIVYVDGTNGSSNGVGTSWATANSDLAEVLKYLDTNATSVTEVWVAKGTYIPKYEYVFEEGDPMGFRTPSDPRNAIFYTSAISLYGGFDPANDVTDLTHKRDSSLTILSGNIGNLNDYTDNTYNLLLVYTKTEITVDGFTMTGAYYDNTPYNGRITNYFDPLYSHYSAAVLLFFRADGSKITFTHNSVKENKIEVSVDQAYSLGGGVYIHDLFNYNGYSDIELYMQYNSITQNEISGYNVAGGGIYWYCYNNNYSTGLNGKYYIEDNYIADNKLYATNNAKGAGIHCDLTGGGAQWVRRNVIENNEIQLSGTNLSSSAAMGGGINLRMANGNNDKNPFIPELLVSYNKVNNNKITLPSQVGNSNLRLTGAGINFELLHGGEGGQGDPVAANSNLSIMNNEIAGNSIDTRADDSALAMGGGMYVNTSKVNNFFADMIFYITNNTIVDNKHIAYDAKLSVGAGLCIDGKETYATEPEFRQMKVTATNNLAWRNTIESTNDGTSGFYTSSTSDFVYVGEEGVYYPEICVLEKNWLGTAYLYNTTTKEPAAISISNTNSVGNAATDPLFFDSSNADASQNNYRLKLESPAANYGTNSYFNDAGGDYSTYPDLYGIARVVGASIAAGAYEEAEYIIDCPPILVWLGYSSDWHNTDNWYPASSTPPQDCTDVYITGASVLGLDEGTYVFPSLTGNAGDGIAHNTCRDIYFMPGAQLGQPQLLDYRYASVQIDYNTETYSSFAPEELDYEALVAIGRDNIDSQDRVQFGAKYSGTTMHRGYWNMFSAPLKEITTGDFAFGGFPFSYIKQYDATVDNETSYIKGNWADMINDSKTAFDPGQGFGHYFYPYMNQTPYGMDKDEQWSNVTSSVTAAAPKHVKAKTDAEDATPFGLAHSNGILHFPYYADEYLSDARRAHEFTPESDGSKAGTSKFHFFWRSPLTSANFMQWDGTVESVDRTAASHRFIFEGWNNNTRSIAGTFAAGDIVLVGNPYMSALDFDEFQGANDAKIKKVYHIYDNGTSYITYGTEATGANTTDKFIAPMQSFLVEVKAATSDLQLVFNPATMAGTSTTTMLKSSRPATDNRLTITASNATGEVSAWVRQSNDADDAFCGEDFSKIIDAANTTPQVYTLAPTEDGKARALLLNSIQSSQTVVPIGLATTHSGDVTLTVSGMDSYKAKVYFEDSASDYRIEITGEEEFSYNFIHDGSTTEGRFSLSFAPENTTGMDSNDFATQATAYVNGSDLIVLSSGDNRITAIEVYDLQSRLLSTQAVPASSQYKLNNVLTANGAYIVKVYGEKGVSSIKVIR